MDSRFTVTCMMQTCSLKAEDHEKTTYKWADCDNGTDPIALSRRTVTTIKSVPIAASYRTVKRKILIVLSAEE